jgi:hypothetical protein
MYGDRHPPNPITSQSIRSIKPNPNNPQSPQEDGQSTPTPSPSKNPLLPNPSHELNQPLAHPPPPTRARQNFLSISLTLTFTFFQQNQLIHILAISGTNLPGPLVLPKVRAGEVGGGVGSGARGKDGDGLGCEGVLGGYGVETVFSEEVGWLEGWHGRWKGVFSILFLSFLLASNFQ